MKTISIISIVTAFILTSFTDLVAQEEMVIEPGDRVRVTVSSKIVGTVVTFVADTLVLKLEGQSTWAVPLASMKKLEVSRGRKSNVGKGAGRGFLIGAALGVTVGALTGGGFGDCDFTHDTDSGGCSAQFALVGGLAFGLLGAGIGAIAGGANPGEEWQEVPVEKPAAGEN